MTKILFLLLQLQVTQRSVSAEGRAKVQPESQASTDVDKDLASKTEPRRVKIFDGGYGFSGDDLVIFFHASVFVLSVCSTPAGTSPTKSTCMYVGVGVANTSVRNVESAVRSQACCANTSAPTLTSGRTTVSSVTSPSRQKVGYLVLNLVLFYLRRDSVHNLKQCKKKLSQFARSLISIGSNSFRC